VIAHALSPSLALAAPRLVTDQPVESVVTELVGAGCPRGRCSDARRARSGYMNVSFALAAERQVVRPRAASNVFSNVLNAVGANCIAFVVGYPLAILLPAVPCGHSAFECSGVCAAGECYALSQFRKRAQRRATGWARCRNRDMFRRSTSGSPSAVSRLAPLRSRRKRRAVRQPQRSSSTAERWPTQDASVKRFAFCSLGAWLQKTTAFGGVWLGFARKGPRSPRCQCAGTGDCPLLWMDR